MELVKSELEEVPKPVEPMTPSVTVTDVEENTETVENGDSAVEKGSIENGDAVLPARPEAVGAPASESESDAPSTAVETETEPDCESKPSIVNTEERTPGDGEGEEVLGAVPTDVPVESKYGIVGKMFWKYICFHC